ncbi:MAG: DNA alkylation repair protein [Bryobacteraceae bacterium]
MSYSFCVQAKLTATQVKRALAELADAERATSLARFFKTGKGEYGEGDRFLGITVPQQREVAAKYRELSLDQVARLLKSPYHELRSVALAILALQFKGGQADVRQCIFDFYLTQIDKVNSWDLVDASAPYIAGQYLLQRPREILYQLARSDKLWERRIAIVSTLAFVKTGQLDDAFAISEMLLGDKHDLIHKAVGWVLRESGKISRPRQLQFIADHYSQLPRTALRYAIEHLSPRERKQILMGDLASLSIPLRK